MSSLTYDELNIWCSDALKLYYHQRDLNVSGSKQELVARLFAASETGIPLQPTAKERITTTANEKARLFSAFFSCSCNSWMCRSLSGKQLFSKNSASGAVLQFPELAMVSVAVAVYSGTHVSG